MYSDDLPSVGAAAMVLEHYAFLFMRRVLYRSTNSQGHVHRLKIQQHDGRQKYVTSAHLKVKHGRLTRLEAQAAPVGDPVVAEGAQVLTLQQMVNQLKGERYSLSQELRRRRDLGAGKVLQMSVSFPPSQITCRISANCETHSSLVHQKLLHVCQHCWHKELLGWRRCARELPHKSWSRWICKTAQGHGCLP